MMLLTKDAADDSTPEVIWQDGICDDGEEGEEEPETGEGREEKKGPGGSPGALEKEGGIVDPCGDMGKDTKNEV